MTAQTMRQRIEAELWPAAGASPLGVWAVLDCARDPRIYAALLESRLEFRCLYAGRLARELEMTAPQLVELLPGHRFTARLIDEGWGRAWGIFLRIADPSNLRHHLRKFLKVRDEQGRPLLFRYYDPRVLRAFLPTCLPDEVRQLFGPVTSLLSEGGDGRSLLEFSRGPAGLKTRRIAVPAPQAGTAQQRAG